MHVPHGPPKQPDNQFTMKANDDTEVRLHFTANYFTLPSRPDRVKGENQIDLICHYLAYDVVHISDTFDIINHQPLICDKRFTRELQTRETALYVHLDCLQLN